MDKVFCVLFYIVIIALAVMMISMTWYSIKAKEYMNIPKEMPVTDDCIWQARKLVAFIRRRLSEINGDPFSDIHSGMNKWVSSLEDSHDIVDLIRAVHLAGCHIRIEQISDEDIETKANTKEVLKSYHTDLSRSRTERMEEKYKQRY